MIYFFFYLQQLHVCLFYRDWIQLTHHVGHHGEVAPHHSQFYLQLFYLEYQQYLLNKQLCGTFSRKTNIDFMRAGCENELKTERHRKEL